MRYAKAVLLSSVFIFVFVKASSGQTPTQSVPEAQMATVTTVVVEKQNGDRLSGIFAGGDERVLRIRISDTTLTIPLSEISLIRIKSSAATGESASPAREPVVVKARAIPMPHPEYPKEAKKNRDHGTVRVEISINEFGRVISARAVQGDPIFYPSAEKAAMKGLFEPKTIDGKAVPTKLVVEFEFEYR